MRWPWHHRHKPKKNIAATPQVLQGLQLSSSAVGLAIPLVYGQARLPGNLIHYKQTFLASGSTRSDAAAIAMAIAEGPIAGVLKAYNDKDQTDTQVDVFLAFSQFTPGTTTSLTLLTTPDAGSVTVQLPHDGSLSISAIVGNVVNFTAPIPIGVAAVVISYTYPGSLATKGFSTFLGTLAQAAWSFLTTNYPAEAVPYELTAYLANDHWPIPNGQLENWSFEVQALLQWGSGIVDANPKDIVTDFLTDPNHGTAFPSALLADLTQFRDYCTAAGIFLSPVFDTQRPAADHLQELLAVANSAFVWSDAKLKIVPFGDTAITGNGVTFTPNVTPLYDLTDNDFLAAEGEDPVRVTRRAQSDVYNMVQVEFDNRAYDYNGDIAEAKDQASIEQYQLKPAPVIKAPFIKTAALARFVAQLALQRQLYIRNTYEFRLGFRYVLLEPMDLVTLTDANLGLSQTTVRLTQVEEQDDGSFLCTAEEWPFGVATAAAYTTAGSGASPKLGNRVGADTANALLQFRVLQELPADGTYPYGALVYGWVNGDLVAEVWAGMARFTDPLPTDPWAQVLGAAPVTAETTILLVMGPLPTGTATITVPKPPEGSQVLVHLEPRLADLTPGPLQRLVVNASPSQLPLIELDDAENGTVGTQWWSITERGLAVTLVQVQTQVGTEPVSAFGAPTRGPGAASVVRGGLLGTGQYEHDVTLDATRLAWIIPRLTLSNGGVKTLGPFGFDRDKRPNILSVQLIGTVLTIICDSDTKSIKVSNSGGTWIYQADGVGLTVDVSKTGTNGAAGLGASSSDTYTITAQSDPLAYVDVNTLTESRTQVVGGASAPPATAVWQTPGVTVTAPATIGSDAATINLFASAAPIGWTVVVYIYVAFSSSGTPTVDHTADLSPALSAPPTVATDYSYATGFLKSAHTGGTGLVTMKVRADLKDGGGVVQDTRSVTATWYSPV